MNVAVYNLSKKEWMVYIEDGPVIHKGFKNSVTIWTVINCVIRAKIYRVKKNIRKLFRKILEKAAL